MQRIHATELADHKWLPRRLRSGLTDYLRHGETVMRPYHPVLPRLRAALESCGASRVIDLCSGASGPWVSLLEQWDKDGGPPLEVVLTDYQPEREAWLDARARSGGRLQPNPEPVDARAVPKHLDGFRTLFAAFHHFRPNEAAEILRDAVERRQGIAILEITQRTPRSLALACFSWLFVGLLTPSMRPVRGWRLFLTYVLPLIPLIVTFDGVVSCLRSYTPEELAELAQSAAASGYDWQIGEQRYPGFPIPVTYLIGVPRP